MNLKKLYNLIAILTGLSLVSCRPVITIGWQEILTIFVLLTILIGPMLFNLYQRWEKFKANIKPKNRQK